VSVENTNELPGVMPRGRIDLAFCYTALPDCNRFEIFHSLRPPAWAALWKWARISG
jgi:hypothetical protein